MKKKAKTAAGKGAKKSVKKAAPKAKMAAHKPTQNQKLTPLGDRVLLKSIEVMIERKTDSGIFIPDTVKDDKGAKRAKVVAVGEGRMEDGKIIPVRVKIGDVVLYSWGDDLTIDGENYILVRESEISAIVRE